MDSLNLETIYRGRINHWAHVSAGGILLRHGRDGFEVFLLRETAAAGGWNFPRGTMTDEGSILKTALREVEEEAGYASRVIAYLGSVQSTYMVDGWEIAKTTLYYVLSPTKQISVELQEHEEGAWFPLAQAPRLLRKAVRREDERDLWERFLVWLGRQDEGRLILALAKSSQY